MVFYSFIHLSQAGVVPGCGFCGDNVPGNGDIHLLYTCGNLPWFIFCACTCNNTFLALTNTCRTTLYFINKIWHLNFRPSVELLLPAAFPNKTYTLDLTEGKGDKKTGINFGTLWFEKVFFHFRVWFWLQN